MPTPRILRLWVAIGSVALFTALAYVAAGQTVPIVPDEVGYLAIARYMATGAALNLAATSNYSFGHAALLAPAFLISGDSATIYRTGLMISCLATALVPAALICIASKASIPRSWFTIACSFLVAVFPAYFYHNALVWSEATFRLTFLLVILAFVSAWATPSLLRWLLFAALVMALYAIHPRALGVIPMTVLALIVARAMQRSTWLDVASTLIAIGLLWLGINQANNHFEGAIWGGDVSESGKIQDFLRVLMTKPGFQQAVAVSLGQLWSSLASSLGFFAIGLYASWQFVRAAPVTRPLIVFSVVALLAVAAASTMQMMQPTRIDHVIYGRYTDGASTVVVWLGLLWLAQERKPAGAAAFTVMLFVLTAGPVLKAFANRPLNPIVTPNISGLLWIDATGIAVATASLLTIIVMGSLLAVAVSSSALATASRPWASLSGVALVAVSASALVMWSATQAHLGRSGYIVISAAAYAKAGGRPVHWDASAASNGNTMIDQFAVASGAMPSSDIAAADIEIGDAAVVADSFQKEGYSLIGDLPDETKLVTRSK